MRINSVFGLFRSYHMRWLSAAVVVTALLVAVFAVPKPAHADQFFGVVEVGQLRVHRSPLSDSPVLGYLDFGTQITVVGRTPDASWLEALTPVGDGWVYAPYVFVSQDVMRSSLPVTSTNIPPYAYVIIYPQINVRTGPSVNYPAFSMLYHGDIVNVIGSDYGYFWLQVQLPDGSTGWIPSQYTYIRGNLGAAPVTSPSVAPVVKAVAYLTPVRSSPDPRSPQIGVMHQGDYAGLIGTFHNIWWQVTGSWGVGFVWAPNVLAVGNLSMLPQVSN